MNYAIQQWFQKSNTLVLPPPPYLTVDNGSTIVNTINLLSFIDGNTPSDSGLLRIIGSGIVGAAGNIDITPSANLEFSLDSGTTWQSTPGLLIYALGEIDTGYTLRVRVKEGSPPASYTETLTVETSIASNVPPHVVNVNGTVTYASSYITATGGIITRDGNYLIHSFNSTDNFVVTGLSSVSTYNDIEALIVAGGGAGATALNGANPAGAGGGGGGAVELTGYPISIASYPCVIGAGGTAAAFTQTNGTNSSFDSNVADGGGCGGDYNGGVNGGAGGCSGGATHAGVVQAASQGNAGGAGTLTPFWPSGGGGGMGTLGENQQGTKSGDGGGGIYTIIRGSTETFAGGGGGGAGNGYTKGLAVNGGGGDGGVEGTQGVAGAANTGGGGGGTGSNGSRNDGIAGGSGIVIIRYYLPL